MRHSRIHPNVNLHKVTTLRLPTTLDDLCPFCSTVPPGIVLQNLLFYARYDLYPVAKGHLLIIPFRHVVSFFELTGGERQAAFELVWEAKAKSDADFRPHGYNVGVNVGQAAGQTVSHVHIHLIPRYDGDMEHPEGGVRGVIPEKRIYQVVDHRSGGLCDGRVHSA